MQHLMQLFKEALVGRKPVRLRASSVGSLFDCPARWMAINLEGKRTAQSDKAALGTAIHAGTALFDVEVLAGQTPSILAATECAVDALRNPGEDTVWDVTREKCEAIACGLVNKYCKGGKPTYVAVEAKCENLQLHDLALELTGSVDRIYTEHVAHTDYIDDQEFRQEFGVLDVKSGTQAVSHDGFAKTKGHGAQMGTYEILAEASLGEPITLPSKILGMQTGSRPESQRISIGEIEGAKEVLLGTGDRPGLLVNAALLIHGVVPPYGNPRSMLCHQNYCPVYQTCSWRK